LAELASRIAQATDPIEMLQNAVAISRNINERRPTSRLKFLGALRSDIATDTAADVIAAMRHRLSAGR